MRKGREGWRKEWVKNASAGNRTRVDSLEGYNSTSKLLMLDIHFDKVPFIFKKSKLPQQ
jgi:hypothetical protein